MWTEPDFDNLYTWWDRFLAKIDVILLDIFFPIVPMLIAGILS
jgi:hypothetical protein